MKKENAFNIIFAGTPAFSAVTLQALIHSRHTIKAVYTQPDRPAGRGRKLTPSPVKELALSHQLPVHQPSTLRDTEEQKILTNIQADLMVVVAYGLLLPLPVLQAPRFGCLNIHASLLPQWRGAAPIQRAILAGDAMTGVTIMQMDEGLDTGAMLYNVTCPIHAEDTSVTLFERLADLGAAALLETLDQFSTLDPKPQDNALATYAHKIKKEEAQLNWELSAIELDRHIRAFNPWPVAFTQQGDTVLRIWKAEIKNSGEDKFIKEKGIKPGTITQVSSQGIDVATGQGILRIVTLQLPGGRAMSAADILNARQNEFAVGTMLG